MIAALIIVFREVFEAGLIVGIVLAVTRTVPRRNQWIAGGVLAGVLGACVVAVFAGALSNLFAGMGQELFNAFILIVAVVMLTWHNVWMARHGSELAGELRAAGQAVVEGSKSLFALAVVVGVAVLREGSEVVLFLYGVLAGGDSGGGVALGGFLGLLLGAAVCMLTYLGLVSIPTRKLFATTTALIALLAAGMAAQAAAFLEKANWLTAMDNVVWDSSWLLSDSSLLGKALHTLIGYTDQPTAMQLAVYLAILAVTFVLMRLYGGPTNTVRSAPAE
ncbi:high-affinity iron transporter [Bradyrhizobium sp. AZCC 2262]|uniref:FTR1 family iron permease n=1 Tax=Bradyrhizobium sp. AZCC 2262 TaxID=3117022 RepID=UPI002FF156DE